MTFLNGLQRDRANSARNSRADESPPWIIAPAQAPENEGADAGLSGSSASDACPQIPANTLCLEAAKAVPSRSVGGGGAMMEATPGHTVMGE